MRRVRRVRMLSKCLDTGITAVLRRLRLGLRRKCGFKYREAGTNCRLSPYVQLLTDLGEVRPTCQMEIKAMKTTQAWGWLTAGVLALGFNGFYHDVGSEF